MNFVSYIYGQYETALTRNEDKDKSQNKCKEFCLKDCVTLTLNNLSSPHGVATLKTLEVASLILKISRAADVNLQKNTRLEEFFNILNEVQRYCFSTARSGFNDIKVLCIEGLSGSGKSSLIQSLVNSKFNGLKFVNANTAVLSGFLDICELFGNNNQIINTALEFVLNYCIAYQIAKSIKQTGYTESTVDGVGDDSNRGVTSKDGKKISTIVLIENFFHAFCAKHVCSSTTTNVDLQSLPASVFEWPIDLPIPHLVT